MLIFLILLIKNSIIAEKFRLSSLGQNLKADNFYMVLSNLMIFGYFIEDFIYNKIARGEFQKINLKDFIKNSKIAEKV